MSSTNLRFIKMVYALGIILVVMFMGCAQQVHEHVYKDTVIAPTCAEKGYTLHKCQTCGDEYKDTYIDMIEHKLKEPETIPHTCTENGYILYKCQNCDYSYKEDNNDPPSHDLKYKYDNDYSTKVHWQECSICHYKTDEEDHSYKNGKCILCSRRKPIALD